MLCAKFGWNWPCVLLKITFFNFVNIFCQFRYNYPLKRCVALDLLFFILFLFSLIKRAWTFIWETWIPNSQKCFVTSWHWPSWSWEEDFLKFPRCIFGIIFRLKNHQRMPNLVGIGPVVLEKNIFKVHQCIFAILLLPPLWKGRCSLCEHI